MVNKMILESYSAGDTIYGELTKADKIYFIKQGEIQLGKYMLDYSKQEFDPQGKIQNNKPKGKFIVLA